MKKTLIYTICTAFVIGYMVGFFAKSVGEERIGEILGFYLR